MTAIAPLLASVCLFISAYSAASAAAGVTTQDAVTSIEHDVRLRALTKGRFFPKGGELVEFQVDGKTLGTTLSGGDGYAFHTYRPASPGLQKIKVASGSSEHEALLLVTDKGDRVVVVGIEEVFIKGMFLQDIVADSREALKEISESFRIVYFTQNMGTGDIHDWLKEEDYPSPVVIKWQGMGTIENLNERGVRVYALVAAPDIISEPGPVDKKFSFGETEDATVLKGWSDLVDELE